MNWWVGAGGDYIGPAATKAAFLAQGYGYAAGPFRTAAAAQAWLNAHPGGHPPAQSGKWWIVAFLARPTAAKVISSATTPDPTVYVTIAGPFPTQAAAQADLTRRNKPPNPFPGNPLAAIGAFLHALSQPRTWLRVAEVLGGGVLIIIGIAQLAGRGPQTIAAVAKTAGKVTLAA